MRRADLHLLGLGVEAGAPVDDAVGLGVDRHEADPVAERGGHVLPEGGAALAFETGALEQARHAQGAQPAHRLKLKAHERVHRKRVDLGGAERDQPVHEVRPPARQRPGQASPAALPDEDGRAVLLVHQPLQPGLETGQGGARTVHVGHHPGPAGPVAAPAQPVRHDHQRPVPGEEARDEHHRAPFSRRHSLAAEDRIAQQRRGLEAEPGFPPDRRPRAAVRRSGSHRGHCTLFNG